MYIQRDPPTILLTITLKSIMLNEEMTCTEANVRKKFQSAPYS